WMKQSLTASLDKYLKLPPCVPPPPPQATTPSTPGGGHSLPPRGGDEGPPPSSGGEGPGPETPPPPKTPKPDCPGANAEEIRRLESEIVTVHSQLLDEKQALENALSEQNNLPGLIEGLEGNIDSAENNDDPNAKAKIPEWQSELEADRKRLQELNLQVPLLQ